MSGHRSGLDEQLAAVQQEHGTGRPGRRPRRLSPLSIAMSAEGLQLTPETRARVVDARGTTTALLVVGDDGRITGQLADLPRAAPPAPPRRSKSRA